MIQRLRDMIGREDCQTQLPDGRWVRAVPLPWDYGLRFNPAAAWAVLWGRAHAVRWPEPGELEDALTPTPSRAERGEGAVERATLAAYDAFFEGQIGCCEPSWDELPDSHKDRMRRSIRAALAAAQEGQR